MLFASRVAMVCRGVSGAGGEVCLVGGWNSEFWNCPDVESLVSDLGLHRAQRDLCCDGSRWRHSTAVVCSHSSVLEGSLVCPGQPHHPCHAAARGSITIGGRRIPRSLVAGELPVGTYRWLVRVASSALHAKQGCDVKKSFPSLPREVVEEASWVGIAANEWGNKSEDITMKEGRASYYGLSWAVKHRFRDVFRRRLLLLCDNLGAVGAFNKGRAHDFGLLRLTRRIFALSVLARVRPRWRFVETFRNPTDYPTRPSNAVMGLSGGAGAYRFVPGRLLLPPQGECAGPCPPGLCGCGC